MTLENFRLWMPSTRARVRAEVEASDRGMGERLSGDQQVRARLTRGWRRAPSWHEVARWRREWNEEKVRDVLRLWASGTALEDSLEEYTRATGRKSIEIASGDGRLRRPDLRGLDVVVLPPTERAEWSGANSNRVIDLSYAQLCGARLTGLGLHGANLARADLRKATLRGVDFSDATLTKADVSDADLRDARFRNARIGYVKFTEDGWLDRGTVLLHEADFREARYLDPHLDRYARDQAYIYVLRARNADKPVKRFLLKLWWLTSNFGQSLSLWAAWCSLVILLFAVLYSAPPQGAEAWKQVVRDHGVRLAVPPDLRLDWPTPLYFSISTFMTLGLGDVRPVNTVGQLAVSSEVILGYFMFGVLLSILANKIARRS